MWSNRSLSSLQKTYDESYLKCSTAVYYEGQGDEKEAMLCWKNALEQIQIGTANKKHIERTPKSEAERTLIKSIRELEIQCQERIDLLEALRLSRQDLNSLGTGTDHRSERDEQTDSALQPSTPTKGWIGDGTIPAITYPELSRTPLPQRPHLPSKSPTESTLSGYRTSIEQVLDQIDSSSSSSKRGPSLPPYGFLSPEKGILRPSSPEKHTMRTTLRSSKPDKPPRTSRTTPSKIGKGPGASKAATLAWVTLNSKTNLDSMVESRISTPGTTESRRSLDQTPSKISAQNSHWDSHTRRLVATPIQRTGPDTDQINTEPGSRKSADYLRNAPSPLAIGAASSALNASSVQERATPNSATKRRPKLKAAGSAGYHSGSYSSSSSGLLKTRSKIDIHARKELLFQDGHNEPNSSRKSCERYHTSYDSEDGLVLSSDEVKPRTNVRRTSLGQSPLKGKKRDLSLAADAATPLSSNASNMQEEEDKSKSQWEMKKKKVLRSLPPGVDESAARAIFNEIVVEGDEVHWSDIAGLEVAKNALREAVVYPFLRPDLFMGLREPARGMLLFGPPGTGKTMLARAVATESKSTFFSISASSLTSKYLGESEKLVRALFALARMMAPSIIFVDEIDSLLSQRSGSGDHETTRRIKTEFLIQWSDLQRAAAGREIPGERGDRGDPTRVLVLAATNLPWAIDEAARRRFVRRQYIPLPEPETRATQLKALLGQQKHNLTEADILELVGKTDGFSGSDITALAKDAAMGPLRSLGEALLHMTMDQIRPIKLEDFVASLRTIRPSVDQEGLKEYEEWARQFGERGG
ncbi:AAA-domain-containing protein [Xylaria nigripes]|nr:AAA-domain-containing protein [Xylaria nigripes]